MSALLPPVGTAEHVADYIATTRRTRLALVPPRFEPSPPPPRSLTARLMPCGANGPCECPDPDGCERRPEPTRCDCDRCDGYCERPQPTAPSLPTGWLEGVLFLAAWGGVWAIVSFASWWGAVMRWLGW